MQLLRDFATPDFTKKALRYSSGRRSPISVTIMLKDAIRVSYLIWWPSGKGIRNISWAVMKGRKSGAYVALCQAKSTQISPPMYKCSELRAVM